MERILVLIGVIFFLISGCSKDNDGSMAEEEISSAGSNVEVVEEAESISVEAVEGGEDPIEAVEDTVDSAEERQLSLGGSE